MVLTQRVMVNFYDFSLPELESFLVERGEKKFRAQQLYRWVYGQGVENFEEMTNLAKSFRAELPQMFELERPKILSHLVSQDGTEKFLFEVEPGMSMEAVAIPSPGRLTLCVSSEVGCNLGCKFCYTGKQKLKRRLTAAQIVGQFLQVRDNLTEGKKITNIVFMGMGEPLDNPEAVFRSIEIFHSPWGLNLSKKKITVSTSGIVPLIPRVTASGARLAVSLNGADDQIRSEIMPINKKWSISVLLEACRRHAEEARDKVTLEYVLLKGVTDSLADARKLYNLTKSVPCKINIIPFNEHPGSEYERPSESAIDAFQQELIRLGSHVLRRKTMGRDIYAACGQLTSAKKNHPVRMSL